MDRAQWIVLGAGSILPRAGYGPAGYALRTSAASVTLFDCGPGTIRNLAACGIELREVVRVVISHFHVDHWLDLFALAFARKNPALSELPAIEIVGPVGIVRRHAAAADAFGSSACFDDARFHEVEPVADVRAIEVEGLQLAYVRTRHTDTSLAWRANLPGRSVTFTGDTTEVPEVARLAADTDLLVAECSFSDEDATPNHLTPTRAARLARDAGAKRLLLTHFYPGLDPERARQVAAETFAGPIEVAKDGSIHPF